MPHSEFWDLEGDCLTEYTVSTGGMTAAQTKTREVIQNKGAILVALLSVYFVKF